MGIDKKFVKMQSSVTKHAYFDLSHVSPLVFLYLLKGCYAYGTCKATSKFRALQYQVHLVLLNNSHTGPATFIADCLCMLPIFDTFFEGIGHLVTSALRRFLKVGYTNDEDLLKAKISASKLFLDIVNGTLPYDEGIAIKILQAFDVSVINIETAISDLYMKRNTKADTANEVISQYISKLLDVQSYMTAVDMLIHFSIRQSGESFLLRMIESQQFKPAEKWAMFMGKPMLCLLVNKYVDLKLLESAYDIIKKNDLRQEFPELHHQSKESALKKLAEKGVWDIAEARAHGDRQLLEYLVYLAMEAGYSEKVEELCDRHYLKPFLDFKEPEANSLHNHHLHLDELFIEEVVWVDEVNGLRDATCYFEECKVIGLDCEWKPNYQKGSKPSKVSIMQVASEKKVYIFDLIKLHDDMASVLDECFTRILYSPSILKLGYNFQCDVKQLAQSYGDLNCFKRFEMLLDIQNMFNEPRGGLSGLAEKILGTKLDKTRRNSNWEQRPLSHFQLEYAALDAAVLLHIFRHVRCHSQSGGDPDGYAKIEWKSHIVSHLDSSKAPKKEAKARKERTDALIGSMRF